MSVARSAIFETRSGNYEGPQVCPDSSDEGVHRDYTEAIGPYQDGEELSGFPAFRGSKRLAGSGFRGHGLASSRVIYRRSGQTSGLVRPRACRSLSWSERAPA